MCFKKPDGKLLIDLYGDWPAMNLQLNHDIYALMKKKKLMVAVEVVQAPDVLLASDEVREQ